MYENELQVLPLLEKEGRIILTDTVREVHEQFVGSGLPLRGTPNSSVDRFVVKKDTGKLVLHQRRFYNSKGRPEQDFDYIHKDEKKIHLFPHIHVWVDGARQAFIRYR